MDFTAKKNFQSFCMYVCVFKNFTRDQTNGLILMTFSMCHARVCNLGNKHTILTFFNFPFFGQKCNKKKTFFKYCSIGMENILHNTTLKTMKRCLQVYNNSFRMIGNPILRTKLIHF